MGRKPPVTKGSYQMSINGFVQYWRQWPPKPQAGLVALIALAALSWQWRSWQLFYSQEQQKFVAETPVAGFEIQEIGFDNQALPMWGIGYGRQLPYKFIVYKGETHTRTKRGGLVSFRDRTDPTQYLVVEELLERQSKGWGAEKTKVTVVDKTTGKVVAFRNLKRGQIENQTGWTGDHANAFIRQALPPSPAPSAPLRYIDEAKQLTTVQEIPVTPKVTKRTRVHGCNADFVVSLEGPIAELKLNTAKWRFAPHETLDGVFCSNGYVLVVSSTFPGTLYLDVLKLDGEHLGTMEIGVPGDLLTQRARVAEIEFGSVNEESVVFQVQHDIPVKTLQGSWDWTPYQRSLVIVRMPEIR